jgi:hypothetical protein
MAVTNLDLYNASVAAYRPGAVPPGFTPLLSQNGQAVVGEPNTGISVTVLDCTP